MADDELPHTSDPFVLLGITADADAATVRRAYAARIRMFRPDRAPEEFRRIHAAFEQITAHRGRVEPHSPPSPERPVDTRARPRPPEAPPDLAQDVAAKLAEARGASAEEAAAIIETLLDARTPLQLLVHDENDRRTICRHPVLTWARLARASDDQAAIAMLWEMAWDDALEHDHARALQLLDDPMLRVAASNDTWFAAQLIPRIGALAWRYSYMAGELLHRYRAELPLNATFDHLFDTVRLELGAIEVLRDRELPAQLELVPHLLRAAHDPEHREEIGRRLHAELDANVAATLAAIAELRTKVDVRPLIHYIAHLLPYASLSLAAMPSQQFDSLAERLERIGGNPIAPWLVAPPILGFIVLMIAAATQLTPFVVAGFVLLLGGIALIIRALNSAYPLLRRGVVGVISDLHVSHLVIVHWIRVNGRRSGALHNFHLTFERDEDLAVFAALVSVAATIGDLEVHGR